MASSLSSAGQPRKVSHTRTPRPTTSKAAATQSNRDVRGCRLLESGDAMAPFVRTASAPSVSDCQFTPVPLVVRPEDQVDQAALQAATE
jgi:hypothetical protein